MRRRSRYVERGPGVLVGEEAVPGDAGAQRASGGVPAEPLGGSAGRVGAQ